MISKLSLKTAVFFSNNNIISSEDIDAYAYGLEILISTVINFMAAIFIAMITGEFISFTLCLIPFLSLRINAGGYHADTHLGCVSVLTAVLLLFAAAVKLLPYTAKAALVPLFLIISSAAIIRLAPVEHPNHPLSEASGNKLRKTSLILLFVWTAVCIAFYFIMPELAFCCASGILISAGALIAEVLKLRHDYNK